MKALKPILSVLLVLCLVFSLTPGDTTAATGKTETTRGVQNSIIIDTDPTGGYEGDYVVIYNPATSSSTSYSTGTLTGLIETTIEANASTFPIQSVMNPEKPMHKIDIDSALRAQAAQLMT